MSSDEDETETENVAKRGRPIPGHAGRMVPTPIDDDGSEDGWGDGAQFGEAYRKRMWAAGWNRDLTKRDGSMR